jgi:histone deacetylase 11
MIIYYHPRYDISAWPFSLLHPFDGKKFGRVWQRIRSLESVQIEQVLQPVSDELIKAFVGELLGDGLTSKGYVLRALELPNLPLVPFSLIDNRVLQPMRWCVGGTLQAATRAVEQGVNTWNLGGGYHHASRKSAEGFCLYNDIGMACDWLRSTGRLAEEDRVLIVDVDAHHGNGNAYVFREDARVTLLDIYNADIYPHRGYTKERVDINLPLASGTEGSEYLATLQEGLDRLQGGYKLAFVVAGTDVLASDPLGRLGLSVDDCVRRDGMVLASLRKLGVPAVVLGGGGYGPESAQAISASLTQHYRL